MKNTARLIVLLPPQYKGSPGVFAFREGYIHAMVVFHTLQQGVQLMRSRPWIQGDELDENLELVHRGLYAPNADSPPSAVLGDAAQRLGAALEYQLTYEVSGVRLPSLQYEDHLYFDMIPKNKETAGVLGLCAHGEAYVHLYYSVGQVRHALNKHVPPLDPQFVNNHLGSSRYPFPAETDRAPLTFVGELAQRFMVGNYLLDALHEMGGNQAC